MSIEDWLNRFLVGIPHGQLLGLKLDAVYDQGLIVRLPYSGDIVGNPATGTVHGGAITTLMDQSCSMAVMQALAPDFDITPTIDLRIDYMKPAEPGQDILAYVEAYRTTQKVVFTRGVAYQTDRSEPIANCVANFMRMGLTSKFMKPGDGGQNA